MLEKNPPANTKHDNGRFLFSLENDCSSDKKRLKSFFIHNITHPSQHPVVVEFGLAVSDRCGDIARCV
jgi:hypothetical protein